MEMIAMLGGLGATQPGFSPEGAAFASQISAAPTIEALAVVVTAIDSAKGSLRPDEVSALKVIAMQKKDDLLTPPFYKRPGYWLVIAGLAAAWYHREKIKRAVGLDGLGSVSDWRRSVDDSYSLRRGNLYAAAYPSGVRSPHGGMVWKWFVIDESRQKNRRIAEGRASNLVEASMRAEKKMK